MPNCKPDMRPLKIRDKTDTVYDKVRAMADGWMAELNEILKGGKRDPIIGNVVNVSMGSNWGKNISDELFAEIKRKTDEEFGHGKRPRAKLISELKKQGVFIFLSAGNDNREAKYNSFLHLLAADGEKNMIIVEASNDRGEKLPMSNFGGHITCPSPLVLSDKILAKKESELSALEKPAKGATSFATPVCSAAFALLQMHRPKYLSHIHWRATLLDCFLTSGKVTPTKAYSIDLVNAADKCPELIEASPEEFIACVNEKAEAYRKPKAEKAKAYQTLADDMLRRELASEAIEACNLKPRNL